MYRNEDNEDLRSEIYRLKKQLSQVNSENHLLKVKIRKLQDEVNKRDKQMDTLLNPKNAANFHKIIYERSANFLVNMKDKNEKLQKALNDKDTVIRRLQNNLQTAKLYSQTYKGKSVENDLDSTKFCKIRLKVPSTELCEEKNTNFGSYESVNNSKRGLSWESSDLLENNKSLSSLIERGSDDYILNKTNPKNYFKDQYRSLSKDHLLSIIENLKSNRCSPTSQHRPTSSRKTASPESDLDRIELLCESPHEEIQQLHQHFLEMLSEIDYLKSTIGQLQSHQAKTESVLKEKGDNIGKLAEEIKGLKKPKKSNHKKKIANINNNNAVIASIYSGHHQIRKNKKKSDGKVVQKKSHNKSKQVTELLIAADDDNCLEHDNELGNQIKYVEKDQIFITRKAITSKISIREEKNKELSDKDQVSHQASNEISDAESD